MPVVFIAEPNFVGFCGARFHKYVKLGGNVLLILYGVLLYCILLHNLYIRNKTMLSLFITFTLG